MPHIFHIYLFYIRKEVKVGYFSSINQLILLNSEFKTSASRCCANQKIAYDDERLLFKQTYLRRCSNLWRGRYDDFIMICVQVAEYLLEHQWMFIRHIRVPNHSGSIRCVNRLSCQFVVARYNLAPPHCSQVSMSISKTRLSLSAQVIDWCFCARVFSCSVGNACLVLFRFASEIVTRCRLFGGGPPRECRPAQIRYET
jgi:hypothetical protein